jgi:hypothetical protein
VVRMLTLKNSLENSVLVEFLTNFHRIFAVSVQAQEAVPHAFVVVSVEARVSERVSALVVWVRVAVCPPVSLGEVIPHVDPPTRQEPHAVKLAHTEFRAQSSTAMMGEDYAWWGREFLARVHVVAHDRGHAPSVLVKGCQA